MTPWVDATNASLLTDLYEFTMAGAYHAASDEDTVTFELWVRSLPDTRNFLVVAGVDDALSLLGSLAFDDESIGYLRGLGRFSEPFLRSLGRMTFGGDVWAIPEGTIAFAGEPIMQITAPIVQAQLVETLLLNTVGFQTMIASKAARVTLAAGGRAWADFGARRAHAADAALKGARAAYVGGASATSLVLAGKEYGIPTTGTMAHSFVLAHDDELSAFVAFARTFPNDATLLVDTFDTVGGVEAAVEASRILSAEGIDISGIRLDSGDLGALAARCREILDAAELDEVRIIASGGLDEWAVERLLGEGAPIDAFGVGTRLLTSDDAPSLDIVYKLVRDDDGPRMKTSTGKTTLPDIKQVYRFATGSSPVRDLLCRASEEPPKGAAALLARVMRNGHRVAPAESLTSVRSRVLAALGELPRALRSLDPADPPYPVDVSEELTELARRLTESAAT